MEDRPETHSNQRALVLTLIFVATETLFCGFLLLQIPSDAKNVFLFGLSKERLMMLAGFGVLLFLYIFLFSEGKRFMKGSFPNQLQRRFFSVLPFFSPFSSCCRLTVLEKGPPILPASNRF